MLRNEDVDNMMKLMLEESNRLVEMRAWFMSWERNDIKSLRFQYTELHACAKKAHGYWMNTKIALFHLKHDQYDGWWVDMKLCSAVIEVIKHHWPKDPDCETSPYSLKF